MIGRFRYNNQSKILRFNLLLASLGSRLYASTEKGSSKIGMQTKAKTGVAQTQYPVRYKSKNLIKGIENAAKYLRSLIKILLNWLLIPLN